MFLPADTSANELSSLGQRALRYWDSKRAGRRMPAWRDVDATEILDLLPYVLVFDVLEPLDFRMRLMGTQVRAISTGDHTGRRMSEMPGKGPDSLIWAAYAQVARTGRPGLHRPCYVGPSVLVRLDENLVLPLSNDGETVAKLLVVVHFSEKAPCQSRFADVEPLSS